MSTLTSSLPQKPELTTKLPGPKAAALMAVDKKYISPSYTRGYPLVMEFGEGMMVRDPDGNIFLDFAAGIAVNATGHRHPRIVDAIKKGLDEGFMHMSGTDFYYSEQIRLAERLAELCGGNRRVFFGNSGAEAIEGALKLARWRTRRTEIISMRGAFHGRTYGAMSVANSKAVHRRHFHPLVAGVHHMPYADPYRGPREGQSAEAYAEECIAYLKNTIFKRECEPDQIAAIICEPIQGEGGYVIPPDNFLPMLREVCDEHGIMLIMDEVQAGFGRTGKLYAHMHFGIEADIICSAKGIASGMPLGAIIAKEEVMQWEPGTHASTFGGNPLACRASMATLDLLEEGLMDNATKMGSYLIAGLQKRLGDHPSVGNIRGKGLMIAVDFVKDRASKAHDGKLRDEVVDDCFYRGLLVLGCGESALRLCPSLILEEHHCDTALDILAESVKACAKG